MHNNLNMKNLILIQFFFTFTLLSLSVNLNAQIGEIVGQGLTEVSYPLRPYYWYAQSQSIYLQSEIGSAKIITGLEFEWDGTNGGIDRVVDIYLGHTTKDFFYQYSRLCDFRRFNTGLFWHY